MIQLSIINHQYKRSVAPLFWEHVCWVVSFAKVAMDNAGAESSVCSRWWSYIPILLKGKQTHAVYFYCLINICCMILYKFSSAGVSISGIIYIDICPLRVSVILTLWVGRYRSCHSISRFDTIDHNMKHLLSSQFVQVDINTSSITLSQCWYINWKIFASTNFRVHF